MSWSAGVSAKAADELFDALDAAFTANYPNPSEGTEEQFEAAKECVDSLLNVVGGETYNCSLSGHRYQGEGSSPDNIMISLNVAS